MVKESDEEVLAGWHVQTSEFEFYDCLDGKLDSRGRLTTTYPHRKNCPVKILVQPPLESPEEIQSEMDQLVQKMNEVMMQVGMLIERLDGRL